MSRVRLELLAYHGRPCPYCNVVMRAQPPKKRSKGVKYVHINKGEKLPDCFPTRDHVVAKSLMPGQPRVIVCCKCNRDKGAKTLVDWNKRLHEEGDVRASVVNAFVKANPHLKITVK